MIWGLMDTSVSFWADENGQPVCHHRIKAENTLILFLGDNGGDAPLGDERGYGSAAPLRGKRYGI